MHMLSACAAPQVGLVALATQSSLQDQRCTAAGSYLDWGRAVKSRSPFFGGTGEVEQRRGRGDFNKDAFSHANALPSACKVKGKDAMVSFPRGVFNLAQHSFELASGRQRTCNRCKRADVSCSKMQTFLGVLMGVFQGTVCF